MASSGTACDRSQKSRGCALRTPRARVSRPEPTSLFAFYNGARRFAFRKLSFAFWKETRSAFWQVRRERRRNPPFSSLSGERLKRSRGTRHRIRGGEAQLAPRTCLPYLDSYLRGQRMAGASEVTSTGLSGNGVLTLERSELTKEPILPSRSGCVPCPMLLGLLSQMLGRPSLGMRDADCSLGRMLDRPTHRSFGLFARLAANPVILPANNEGGLCQTPDWTPGEIARGISDHPLGGRTRILRATSAARSNPGAGQQQLPP